MTLVPHRPAQPWQGQVHTQRHRHKACAQGVNVSGVKGMQGTEREMVMEWDIGIPWQRSQRLGLDSAHVPHIPAWRGPQHRQRPAGAADRLPAGPQGAGRDLSLLWQAYGMPFPCPWVAQ